MVQSLRQRPLFRPAGQRRAEPRARGGYCDVRVWCAKARVPELRRYAGIRYGAKSWGCKRRVSARSKVPTLVLGIGPRHPLVVTNLRTGSAEWRYNTLFCPRGQAPPDREDQGYPPPLATPSRSNDHSAKPSSKH